jgi:hypothetical protein
LAIRVEECRRARGIDHCDRLVGAGARHETAQQIARAIIFGDSSQTSPGPLAETKTAA